MTASEPLTEVESSWVSQIGPSITTITYFNGDVNKAAIEIKKRLHQVVNANPWLAGKIVRNNTHKRLQIEYPIETPVSDDAINKIFYLNPAGLQLSSTTPYKDLAKTAASAIVPITKSLVNNPTLLTRLTLVTDPQKKSAFSLIFSMSHTAGDGYTYYKILNMLSNKSELESLCIRRRDDANPQMEDAMGKTAWKFMLSLSHTCNIIRGILFGGKARAYAFYVDDNMVEEQKNHTETNKSDVDASTDDIFVSTNDILVSSFSNFIDARLTIMNINFRNKLPGINPEFAGNYTGVIFYDKEGYLKPVSIRKSIKEGPPYKGLYRGVPGFIEGAFGKLGLITNWASFAGDLIFDGCDETLHLPLYDLRQLPYDAAIIFRPKHEKLGVIFMTKRFHYTNFVTSLMPINETVSKDIFTH